MPPFQGAHRTVSFEWDQVTDVPLKLWRGSARAVSEVSFFFHKTRKGIWCRPKKNAHRDDAIWIHLPWKKNKENPIAKKPRRPPKKKRVKKTAPSPQVANIESRDPLALGRFYRDEFARLENLVAACTWSLGWPSVFSCRWQGQEVTSIPIASPSLVNNEPGSSDEPCSSGAPLASRCEAEEPELRIDPGEDPSEDLKIPAPHAVTELGQVRCIEESSGETPDDPLEERIREALAAASARKPEQRIKEAQAVAATRRSSEQRISRESLVESLKRQFDFSTKVSKMLAKELTKIYNIGPNEGRDFNMEAKCNIATLRARVGDMKSAIKIWRELAECGEPNAQYNLGICYSHGKGVERNVEEAQRWLTLSKKDLSGGADAAMNAIRVGRDHCAEEDFEPEARQNESVEGLVNIGVAESRISEIEAHKEDAGEEYESEARPPYEGPIGTWESGDSPPGRRSFQRWRAESRAPRTSEAMMALKVLQSRGYDVRECIEQGPAQESKRESVLEKSREKRIEVLKNLPLDKQCEYLEKLDPEERMIYAQALGCDFIGDVRGHPEVLFERMRLSRGSKKRTEELASGKLGDSVQSSNEDTTVQTETSVHCVTPSTSTSIVRQGAGALLSSVRRVLGPREHSGQVSDDVSRAD